MKNLKKESPKTWPNALFQNQNVESALACVSITGVGRWGGIFGYEREIDVSQGLAFEERADGLKKKWG